MEIHVRVALHGTFGSDSIIFHVVYVNGSAVNINVFPEHLEVLAVYDHVQRALKVFAADEYLRRRRRRQNTALFLKAMAGAMEAQSAGTSTTTSTGNFRGQTSGGSSYGGSYAGSSTTIDRSKQLEAQGRNQQQIAQQAEQFRSSNAAVDQGLIRATTLFPDHYIEGDVMVEKYRAGEYLVRVPFNETVWEFKFRTIQSY